MERNSRTYDYIIAGAGSSGLSLAWHLVNSDLRDKKILIVDRSLEPANDKTWCFWSKGDPSFDHVVLKKWSRAEIFVNDEHIREDLSEFPYYCIRSGDFRRAVLAALEKIPTVTLLETAVDDLDGNENEGILIAEKDTYTADYIFQSCLPPPLKQPPSYPLIQHFLGWEVTTDSEVFEPGSFIFMDLDNTFKKGFSFMYVLPIAKTRALLEYTIFSRSVEPASVYEEKLELYLYNRYGLKRINYSIDRTEYGEIPMEDAVYDPWYASRVLNIGMRGGLTKPSTGFTYSRIQDHSERIIESLYSDQKPVPPPRSPKRYRTYDLWLLQILHDHPEEAMDVFHSLFKNNRLDDIFRFLGEESDFGQDLKIMSSVPWKPFFRAIWKTRKRMLNI